MLPIAVALARARNAMLEIVLLGETAERLPETQAELGARAGRECPRGLRLWVPRNRGAELRRLTEADRGLMRSEEHTSEIQSLMRISYAVFCLKKKTKTNTQMKSS